MTDDLLGGRRWRVVCGDVMEVLADEPENAYDGCFCDPPYGLSFMGKKWDHAVPGPDYWAKVLRVLKPGAMLLAFGGTRTWHRLACAIEDAGFELRDTLMFLHGQGFPKSHDISKAIDKAAGAERERTKFKPLRSKGGKHEGFQRPWMDDLDADAYWESLPATPAAKTWTGYGTALKPAWEPVLLAMRPLDGTFAANALKWGVVGLNVDECRIGTVDDRSRPPRTPNAIYGDGKGTNLTASNNHPKGRWPANLLLSHLPGCEWRGTKRVRATKQGTVRNTALGLMDDDSWEPKPTIRSGYADPDGLETVEAWECAEGCPVKMLNEQSGDRKSGGSIHNRPIRFMAGTRKWGERTFAGYADTGGASRFFRTFEGEAPCRFRYVPKSSRRERDVGLEGMAPMSGGQATNRQDGSKGLQNARAGAGRTGGMRNPHPTVKPLALCEYLARLILPPTEYQEEAKLLVPFCGSGSEMKGAIRAGWRHVLGIEIVGEYCELARARLAVIQAKLI